MNVFRIAFDNLSEHGKVINIARNEGGSRDLTESGKHDMDTQTNGESTGKKKFKANCFDFSMKAIFEQVEENKDSRRCNCCQDVCYPSLGEPWKGFLTRVQHSWVPT